MAASEKRKIISMAKSEKQWRKAAPSSGEAKKKMAAVKKAINRQNEESIGNISVAYVKKAKAIWQWRHGERKAENQASENEISEMAANNERESGTAAAWRNNRK